MSPLQGKADTCVNTGLVEQQLEWGEHKIEMLRIRRRKGVTDGQWFEHRSVKDACALKWGDRETVPWCFMQTMADLSLAFIRGAEAVSGCSSIITFLLCLKTGGKYSPYKGFDTTAKE